MDRSSTKSIDVGGVFLMDMSVSESGASNNCQIEYQQPFEFKKGKPVASNNLVIETSYYPYRAVDSMANATSSHQLTRNPAVDYLKLRTSQLSHQKREQVNSIYRQSDYLGSSLDRLASVINCDEQQQQQNETTLSLSANHESSSFFHEEEQNVTYVEPQQPNLPGRHRYNGFCARSSFSCSDESFAASSDASLSASFTGCSEGGEFENDLHGDGCDKDSITTREDSGVLDMKDLEGQLNSCSSFEEKNCSLSNHNQRSDEYNYPLKEPIASNRTTKNLISGNISKTNYDMDYHSSEISGDRSKIIQNSHRLCGLAEVNICDGYNSSKNKASHNQQNDYHHQSHQNNQNQPYCNKVGRRFSASVPIQVPTREMKKDLKKMKLNLLKEEQAYEHEIALSSQQHQKQQNNGASEDIAADRSHNIAILDDDEAFLGQEFNKNHQNHYPIDELGDEKLTAEDDPMKLFASIQALARSLREDTEIFGSLPPKRTLESPIRSMALV